MQEYVIQKSDKERSSEVRREGAEDCSIRKDLRILESLTVNDSIVNHVQIDFT